MKQRSLFNVKGNSLSLTNFCHKCHKKIARKERVKEDEEYKSRIGKKLIAESLKRNSRGDDEVDGGSECERTMLTSKKPMGSGRQVGTIVQL